MKPLNLDNRPCSPISSNCVIWQGPDISCINICNGDTVSDVVAALATELCTLLDQTNVSNYDLTCLGITACGPKDFQALIQLLINKICELQGVPADTKDASACPDCLVSVAPCFVQNGITTMQLLDYVQMIANKICDLIESIADLQDQIDALNIRVTILEETPPPTFTLPSLTPDCDLGVSSNGTPVNPATSQTIDIVLDALINDDTNGYCVYTAALGEVADLYTAISRKCVNDGTAMLSTPGTFGSLVTWVDDANYDTVADAINNIWLVLCDIFAYNSSTTAVTGSTTNTIDVTVTTGVIAANILDTGWIDLNGFGYYSGATTLTLKPQARRIGNLIHFRGLVTIPIDDGTGAPLIWQYGFGPNIDTYYLSTTVTPATLGPNSVVLATAGTVTFNQGNSVLPTSIIGVGETLDNSYTREFQIAARPIQIDASPVTSSILTAAFNVQITSAKTLLISLPKNAEQNAFSGTAGIDTSHINYIISHVTSGEFVPSFSNAATNVNSSSVSGTTGLDISFNPAQTYPFSCNANDETEVGGFRFSLDGLTAFVQPCTTDIPTAVVCP
jgi:hypothetical protein